MIRPRFVARRHLAVCSLTSWIIAMMTSTLSLAESTVQEVKTATGGKRVVYKTVNTLSDWDVVFKSLEGSADVVRKYRGQNFTASIGTQEVDKKGRLIGGNGEIFISTTIDGAPGVLIINYDPARGKRLTTTGAINARIAQKPKLPTSQEPKNGVPPEPPPVPEKTPETIYSKKFTAADYQMIATVCECWTRALSKSAEEASFRAMLLYTVTEPEAFQSAAKRAEKLDRKSIEKWRQAAMGGPFAAGPFGPPPFGAPPFGAPPFGPPPFGPPPSGPPALGSPQVGPRPNPLSDEDVLFKLMFEPEPEKK